MRQPSVSAAQPWVAMIKKYASPERAAETYSMPPLLGLVLWGKRNPGLRFACPGLSHCAPLLCFFFFYGIFTSKRGINLIGIFIGFVPNRDFKYPNI
jgi:hypothetical protein